MTTTIDPGPARPAGGHSLCLYRAWAPPRLRRPAPRRRADGCRHARTAFRPRPGCRGGLPNPDRTRVAGAVGPAQPPLIRHPLRQRRRGLDRGSGHRRAGGGDARRRAPLAGWPASVSRPLIALEMRSMQESKTHHPPS